MPYIPQDERVAVIPSDSEGILNNTPGHLNYAFTEIIKDYVDHNELEYYTINDVLGALEGAKLEFYRRVVIPYENRKIRENGDVYSDTIAPRIS